MRTVPTSQLWAYDADANAKKNKQHVKLCAKLLLTHTNQVCLNTSPMTPQCADSYSQPSASHTAEYHQIENIV